MNKLPVILHIPHASKTIPSDIRPQFLISDSELKEELGKMTDWFTDELFTQNTELLNVVTFPVSRLVVDPERFTDDSKEIMAQKGMGVIYSSDSNGKTIRKNISKSERQKLLQTYYYPHQKRLSFLVKKLISEFGKCLIIDCHSFPAQPLPYELNQNSIRPDICIGTDRFHSSARIIETLTHLFNLFNFSTALNEPFSGSFVPLDFFQKDNRLQSIMIEVNRSLYLNELTFSKKTNYGIVRKNISSILNKLGLNFTKQIN